VIATASGPFFSFMRGKESIERNSPRGKEYPFRKLKVLVGPPGFEPGTTDYEFSKAQQGLVIDGLRVSVSPKRSWVQARSETGPLRKDRKQVAQVGLISNIVEEW
jgi:hypothetical protein